MEAASEENAAKLAATSKVMAACLDLLGVLHNEFMFVLCVNCAATSPVQKLITGAIQACPMEPPMIMNGLGEQEYQASSKTNM